MSYSACGDINNLRGGVVDLCDQYDGSVGPGALLRVHLEPGQTVLYPAPSPAIKGYSLGAGSRVPTFASCGRVFTVNVCSHDSSHAPLVRRHSCHRVDCPVCFPDWQRRAAERVSRRVSAGAMLLNKWSHYVQHFTISPPASEYAAFYELGNAALPALRKKAVRYLKDIGLEGGALIFHALRQAEYAPDDVNRGWYFSPHFHVIGFGRLTETSDKLYRRTGWVYKSLSRAPRARKFKEVYDTSRGYACGVANYLFSHVAYWSDLKTGRRLDRGDLVSYFGCLSSRALHVYDTIVEKEHVKCTQCGAPMYEDSRYHYDPDWVEDSERATISRLKFCKYRSGLNGKYFEEPGYRARRKRLEYLGWFRPEYAGFIPWSDPRDVAKASSCEGGRQSA